MDRSAYFGRFVTPGVKWIHNRYFYECELLIKAFGALILLLKGSYHGYGTLSGVSQMIAEAYTFHSMHRFCDATEFVLRWNEEAGQSPKKMFER